MSLNLPFMPVSEALNILKQNNYNVEHATLVILNQCNIHITNASRQKIRRKLMKEKKRRRPTARDITNKTESDVMVEDIFIE